MRPELEIRVEEKDTFREVINDSIDIEQRLAANSALRKNKNMHGEKWMFNYGTAILNVQL